MMSPSIQISSKDFTPSRFGRIVLATLFCLVGAFLGVGDDIRAQDEATPEAKERKTTTSDEKKLISAAELAAREYGKDYKILNAPPSPSAYVIPIEGAIEKGLAFFVHRGFVQAETGNATAVILKVNTPGGRVDAAVEIRDRVLRSKIPTYAYVDNQAISAGALISLAADHIVMGPGSKIGAATPISIGPGGTAAPVEEKYISYFRGEMRSTAKEKGHPAALAEAMVDSSLWIPGLVDDETLLTLDYEEALNYHLAAFKADTMRELLKNIGIADAEVVTVKLNWAEHIARFLNHPLMTGLLMLLGLGGLFMEMKAPGFGFAGALGFTCLAIYFWGSYVANLASHLEIIVFFLGLVLLAVEIFVIPGFGAAGITGIVCIVGALAFSLFNLPPEGFPFNIDRLRRPVYTIAGVAALGPIVAVYLSKFFHHTPLWRHIVLKPTAGGTAAIGASSLPNAPTDRSPLVGRRGTALTELRPAGIANIDGKRVDVVTEGNFIPRGATIRVFEVSGNRVVVQRDEPPQGGEKFFSA
ncbi:MAG: NfeD family protein [bacterium]